MKNNIQFFAIYGLLTITTMPLLCMEQQAACCTAAASLPKIITLQEERAAIQELEAAAFYQDLETYIVAIQQLVEEARQAAEQASRAATIANYNLMQAQVAAAQYALDSKTSAEYIAPFAGKKEAAEQKRVQAIQEYNELYNQLHN